MTQYLVLAHFLFNRETRWDVGIPGVCIAFSALWGRLQSSHCQATTHQQENNTSRDQCECTYTLQTGRHHMLPCCHIFKLNLTYHLLNEPGLQSTMQHGKHVLMHCFVLLCSWCCVYSLAEALESLKLLLVLLWSSLCLRDKGWLYMEGVFTQALREVTYHYQRGCPGPSLLVKQSPILYMFKSGEC